MNQTIVIPRRFNGPPDSGNGGYSCGLVAALVDAPAVEVTLKAPPPLERELRVEERDGALAAIDGETVVAEARPTEIELDLPDPIPLVDAAQADSRSPYRDAEGHWFNTCFVCGPNRAEGDGLRMFPGVLPEGDPRFATIFRPDASIADDDGHVLREVVWAALDCPTSAPIADWDNRRPPSVLARLAVRIDQPLHVGREYLSLAWPLGEDGRKRSAGAALYDEAGTPVAVSRALWIELKERPE
jgi:hypothetical protein